MPYATLPLFKCSSKSFLDVWQPESFPDGSSLLFIQVNFWVCALSSNASLLLQDFLGVFDEEYSVKDSQNMEGKSNAIDGFISETMNELWNQGEPAANQNLPKVYKDVSTYTNPNWECQTENWIKEGKSHCPAIRSWNICQVAVHPKKHTGGTSKPILEIKTVFWSQIVFVIKSLPGKFLASCIPLPFLQRRWHWWGTKFP